MVYYWIYHVSKWGLIPWNLHTADRGCKGLRFLSIAGCIKGYLTDVLKRHQVECEVVPRSLFSNLGEDEEKMAVEELRRAQQIIGELQWLTTHTRPDIVYHLGLMARSAHRRPKQVVKMGMELLRYLSSTKTKGLHYQKSSMQKPYGFLMLSGDHSCFVHCLHFIFCCKQCSSPANPTLDLSAKRIVMPSGPCYSLVIRGSPRFVAWRMRSIWMARGQGLPKPSHGTHYCRWLIDGTAVLGFAEWTKGSLSFFVWFGEIQHHFVARRFTYTCSGSPSKVRFTKETYSIETSYHCDSGCHVGPKDRQLQPCEWTMGGRVQTFRAGCYSHKLQPPKYPDGIWHELEELSNKTSRLRRIAQPI